MMIPLIPLEETLCFLSCLYIYTILLPVIPSHIPVILISYYTTISWLVTIHHVLVMFWPTILYYISPKDITVMAIYYIVITGYFCGIIHVINGVFLVLITGKGP